MMTRNTNDEELLRAAEKHNCSLIEALIKAEADVNYTDVTYGQAPPHGAVYNGCLTCTKLLLEHNANSNK